MRSRNVQFKCRAYFFGPSNSHTAPTWVYTITLINEIFSLSDACTYGNKIFTDLFSNLKPDTSWTSTIDTRLNDFSIRSFYHISIIELMKKTLNNKYYEQISSYYLTFDLHQSPVRTSIKGCITNFQDMI